MRLLEFWTSIGWLILLGTISMAFINILKRAIMKSKALSTLQYLILWYASTTVCFGVIYTILWGFTVPELLPGFWRAVCIGAFINIGIQFCNAKAASLDAGEVSFTAPLQAMTPGLITMLSLTLGEFPSKLGVLGVLTMASGSWILMLHKTPDGTYEYLGPLRQLKLLKLWGVGKNTKTNRLSIELHNKMQVVRIVVGSAVLGTFGLLMDGLFTRRGGTLQGLILGAMTFTAIFTLAYLFWYLAHPDATSQQKKTATIYFLKYPGLLLFFGVSLAWILHIFFISPAFFSTYVAYVGTLKRFSILASVILGHILFREGDFKKRFWAACIIILGAILISTDELPSVLSTKIEGLGF